MRIKFVTISDLDAEGPAILTEAERGKIQFVITRRGKPVALIRKMTKKDIGRKESLTDLSDHSHTFLSEIEKGARIIITRKAGPSCFSKKSATRLSGS